MSDRRDLMAELSRLMDAQTAGVDVRLPLIGWLSDARAAEEISALAFERLVREVQQGSRDALSMPLPGTFAMAGYELGAAGRVLLDAVHRSIPERLRQAGAVSDESARAMESVGRVQARVDAVRALVAMASGESSDPAKRPGEEPYGTCYWDDVESGECDNLATAWRWVEEHGGWGPVCEAHKDVAR